MDNTLEPQNRITSVIDFFRTWFQPRATDRDEAFRERVIRIVLAVVLTVTLLNLANSTLVYRSDWAIISFPSMNIYSIIVCLASAYAVVIKRYIFSGIVLTLGILILINFAIYLGLQEDPTLNAISVAAFTLIPLLATIVLPRKYIVSFTLAPALSFGGLLSLIPTGIAPISGFNSMLLVLGLEGMLLFQFRREFDARLSAMTASLEQERIAKDQAEVARQRAEEADKAKSQFLANMSHELRTPLNAIIGYDEAMLGGMVGEFTPKQEQLLGHIQFNSRRLLGLINDILDLSKIESGSMQVFSGPLSPRNIITRTAESVRSLAEEKNIELDLKIDAGAPALVISDERKIEQVITNLLGNAIKFTEKGGVYIEVQAYDKTNWQFSIRDTGVGIAEESLDLIFEPFQQADNSSTRKYKGTGLGLSITKRLVEILNGRIEVESELGQGTTFTVRLPRTLEETQTLEEQLKQAKSKAEHPITT